MATCKIHAREIFRYGVSMSQPDVLVKSVLKASDEKISVLNKTYSLEGKNTHLVGIGKAAVGMARGVEDVLKNSLMDGIILVPYGTTTMFNERQSRITTLQGAKNNLPDIDSVNATKIILDYVKKMNESDILICLVSGGSSALLCAPIPQITVEEKITIIQLLTSRGADIKELNTVRKHLSSVKGGMLGKLAGPAQVISLILSDIIGDPIDLIGSGPTVENSSKCRSEALYIINKYGLSGTCPTSILKILRTVERNDRSNKSDISTESLSHVYNLLIGNNDIVLNAAIQKALDLGYTTHKLSGKICGSAESLGRLMARLCIFLVDIRLGRITNMGNSVIEISEMFEEHGVNIEEIHVLISLSKQYDKLALISGGETVVNVTGNGTGGRNQESALSCCIALKNEIQQNNIPVQGMVFLSAGTDGIDGPTDAAGAMAYIGQYDKAKQCNIVPESYLKNNDSNGFFMFSNPDDLIVSGLSGTNLMDIQVLLFHFNPL